MSIFICEKCGKLDNTACNNNYWDAFRNKNRQSKGEELDISYKPEFKYFENHVCCSDCCDGVTYCDDSGVLRNGKFDIKNKEHWSKYGREKMFEWEKRNDGSMINATEYFKSIDELNNALPAINKSNTNQRLMECISCEYMDECFETVMEPEENENATCKTKEIFRKNKSS